MANEYKGVSCIMAVPFSKNTGTCNATPVDLPYGGGLEADTPSATQGFVMPFDGSVVGMSACEITGSDTYALVCKLNKGATLVSGATLSMPLDTTTLKAYVRWMPTTYNFAAGEVVNVEVTGVTTGYDPGEVIVVVFIQIGKSGT